MKKTYYLMIFLLISFLCKAQKNNIQYLEKELKKESFSIKYVEKKIKNVTIKKPLIIQVKNQKLIDKIISNELLNKYCDDKECKVKIDFKVGQSSDSFISLMRKTNTMFRFPRDVQSIDFYNFIYLKNDLFKIEINKTANFMNRLQKTLKKRNNNLQCDFSIKEVSIGLYFKNGKSFIHVYKDEVCEILLQMNLKDSDLSFVKIRSKFL